MKSTINLKDRYSDCDRLSLCKILFCMSDCRDTFSDIFLHPLQTWLQNQDVDSGLPHLQLTNTGRKNKVRECTM